MCGIAGVFHFRGVPGDTGDVLERMMARLAHRGPDGEGTWRQDNVELGHRRLAILDLSRAGRQPMSSACGRFTISFNGEIYNHEELAEELQLGPLRSRTDTEVLLEGWARRGEAILPMLVGQFAFAIHDARECRVTLVRDRFGEKPLYVHSDARRLTFGSSIHALLAAPWVTRALDPDALVEYMALRFVVSPRTILSGISKLPPGHLMRIDTSGTEVSRWYEIPAPEPGRSDPPGDVVEQFDHLFRQATRRCLVSDVPVALFLSDGIDSHGIAAAAGGHIPSFSYVPRAGAEVETAGSGNTPIRVSDEDRLRDLGEAFRSLTEPVGDGVVVATWQLVRAARDRATVFLCGHGGDEILGGYRLNRDLLSLRALHALRWLPGPLLRPLFHASLCGPEPFVRKLRGLRKGSRADAPAHARYLVSRSLPMSDLREAFGDSVDLSRAVSTIDRLYASIPPGRGDLDRIQSVMARTFLSENLLSFSDAAGMASSAELRMPFLDRDLVEFVLTQPESLRVRARPARAETKRILRRWAHGRLPESVIRRKKRGFQSGNITHLLTADREGVRSRLLDVAELRHAMPGLERWMSHETEHYSGAREGTYWALLALAVWYVGLDAHSGEIQPVVS